MKEGIFMKVICLLFLCISMSACTGTGKTYENETFPDGDWKPINKFLIEDMQKEEK